MLVYKKEKLAWKSRLAFCSFTIFKLLFGLHITNYALACTEFKKVKLKQN